MKILEQEIGLRDETRTLEQARPALEVDKYRGQSEPLATWQQELVGRTHKVVADIRAVPDGEELFPKEIQLLTRVAEVMDEAHGILAQPNTGPEAIAAETEAIELLLQARRIQPGGGGGGGSSPGGGGSGDTQQAALALIGRGAARAEKIAERQVSQATGTTGPGFPAEFRTGLDAYFGALEGDRPLPQ